MAWQPSSLLLFPHSFPPSARLPRCETLAKTEWGSRKSEIPDQVRNDKQGQSDVFCLSCELLVLSTPEGYFSVAIFVFIINNLFAFIVTSSVFPRLLTAPPPTLKHKLWWINLIPINFYLQIPKGLPRVSPRGRRQTLPIPANP